MQWEFKNGIPIYQQIVQILKLQIASGAFSPGEKVPTVRELALEAGVNPNTMQRALSDLEREGLVRSERTSGRFVTQEADRLTTLRRELQRGYIEEMFTRLMALGFSSQEITEAVTDWQKEREIHA